MLIHGDCLEKMKDIPDKSVDMVICDYKSGLSMRQIAIKYKTNHKLIGRILKRNGIKTRPYKNLRGKRKFSCDLDLRYNNMVSHLRWSVSLEWAKQFKDFEKLKFLNRSLTNRDNRFPITTKEYILFIERFYFDAQFNKIYSFWLKTNDKYVKPSIDHIKPRSCGGNNNLANLQFLTWFENRCKNNMSQQDWDNMKINIGDYFL